MGSGGDYLANAVVACLLTVADVRRAQSWLPGLVAQHERLGHCERQALLEVFFAVIVASARARAGTSPNFPAPEAVQSGIFDGSGGVLLTGEVQLFVAHFCCISCLAVMCHFSR